MPRNSTTVIKASESTSSNKERLAGVKADSITRGVAVRFWIAGEDEDKGKAVEAGRISYFIPSVPSAVREIEHYVERAFPFLAR